MCLICSSLGIKSIPPRHLSFKLIRSGPRLADVTEFLLRLKLNLCLCSIIIVVATNKSPGHPLSLRYFK